MFAKYLKSGIILVIGCLIAGWFGGWEGDLAWTDRASEVGIFLILVLMLHYLPILAHNTGVIAKAAENGGLGGSKRRTRKTIIEEIDDEEDENAEEAQ